MAARSRLGGLAEGARGALLVLAAAFDRVFVETVGVGQSESEVAALVDTLLFVAQPASGDLLQFMKAGVLELPDVFAVNKDDTTVASAPRGNCKPGLGLASTRTVSGRARCCAFRRATEPGSTPWKRRSTRITSGCANPANARAGDGADAMTLCADFSCSATENSGSNNWAAVKNSPAASKRAQKPPQVCARSFRRK